MRYIKVHFNEEDRYINTDYITAVRSELGTTQIWMVDGDCFSADEPVETVMRLIRDACSNMIVLN